MTVSNRIFVISDISMDDLLTDDQARKKLQKTLNADGNNGWEPYQLERAGEGLLVFMKKSSP